MLVLSRKQDERILIGEDIVITVVRIGDGKVRLGIDAPRSVPIHREEIAEAIARETADDPGSIVAGLAVPVPLVDQIEAVAMVANRAFGRPDDGEDSRA